MLDTHSEYVYSYILVCNIYCFSAATVVAQTRLNVTLYVHCLSCVTEFPLGIVILVTVKIF